jgi:hypothetical protein
MIVAARDDRLGGFPKWVLLGEDERLMRVPDELRDSVAFVCVESPQGPSPIGTAFFIGVPIEGHDRDAVFTVTARHVLAKAMEQGHDTVSLRMNAERDQPKSLVFAESKIDRWLMHPDGTDVAILLWGPNRIGEGRVVDFSVFPFINENIAAGETFQQHGVGIGDDVFMVGLFGRHIGSTRNEPIIRVGTIAALPQDKIRTPGFGAIDVHLIEARSIGGLSGSPVYVHPGARGGTRFLFFGLVHGHWNIDAAGIEALNGTDADDGERINTGIALVIPAADVQKMVLEHPAIVDELRKLKEILDGREAAEED